MTAPGTDAVRDYLLALRGRPLRDTDAEQAAARKYEESDDPVERLRAHAELTELKSQPSLEELEEAFVAAAKRWAEQEQVPAVSFAAEGVPVEVLERAGFDVTELADYRLEPVSTPDDPPPADTTATETTEAQVAEEPAEEKPKPVRRAAKSSKARSSTVKGKRASAEAVREAMPVERAFTLKDLQGLSGASERLVRDVVKQAQQDGTLVEVAAEQKWGNQGRPPKAYQRVK